MGSIADPEAVSLVCMGSASKSRFPGVSWWVIAFDFKLDRRKSLIFLCLVQQSKDQFSRTEAHSKRTMLSTPTDSTLRGGSEGELGSTGGIELGGMGPVRVSFERRYIPGQDWHAV